MEEIHKFQVQSYIMGYHIYKDIWVPRIGEKIKAEVEPTNKEDKYAGFVNVCATNDR